MSGKDDGRPPLVVTTGEHETYLHRVLWSSVRRLGQIEEPTMLVHAQRAGLVLAAGAIEAYANFLLNVLDREAFDDERVRFRGHGATGKLRQM